MTPSSAALASSAIQAASAASPAIGNSISSGVWSFAGGIVGAAIAVWLAIFQQRKQSERERLKIAADSAGSHMANVAFDKYAQFCEEYAEAFRKALDTLTRHGPSEKVLVDTAELYRIRRRWAIWITNDTDAQLDRFEKVLREIGASAAYVQATIDDPHAHDRQLHINRMYEGLSHVMGYKEWAGKPVGEEHAHYALDALLRRILGTERFDELRSAVVLHALAGLAERNVKN